MFAKKDVAEYYNTTQNHYEKWWKLTSHLSLHYGIWEANTSNFGEAVENTNRIMLKASHIQPTDCVLDAGCGVGGAAFFIHENTKAHVTGISLSEKQLQTARHMIAERGEMDHITFELKDFTQTGFQDASFDVVWACESVCHAEKKDAFIKECFRVLKPGGRLILCDFFIRKDSQEDPNQWIKKWGNTWAVPDFVSLDFFTQQLKEKGFETIQTTDYTSQVTKSARRMYYASLLGAIPSECYNLFHPRVSRFAKTHYKCGYYQYKALKKDLWRYQMVLAVKPNA